MLESVVLPNKRDTADMLNDFVRDVNRELAAGTPNPKAFNGLLRSVYRRFDAVDPSATRQAHLLRSINWNAVLQLCPLLEAPGSIGHRQRARKDAYDSNGSRYRADERQQSTFFVDATIVPCALSKQLPPCTTLDDIQEIFALDTDKDLSTAGGSVLVFADVFACSHSPGRAQQQP